MTTGCGCGEISLLGIYGNMSLVCRGETVLDWFHAFFLEIGFPTHHLAYHDVW